MWEKNTKIKLMDPTETMGGINESKCFVCVCLSHNMIDSKLNTRGS